MAFHIVILNEVDNDLDRLEGFLQPRNPQASRKAVRAIISAIDLLSNQPYLGRVLDEHDEDFREWYAPFGSSSYVIRYKVDTNNSEIIITRIWHGRENRP